MTYFEFTRHFPDENTAIDFIVSVKYKDGYICPKCGSEHKRIYHQHYDRRKLYCKNCNSEFSALVGTIFENTHLDLRMWLYAISLCMVSTKGISALQLQKELSMGSYHSAWRMLNQIRKAMDGEEYKEIIEAIVKIDETNVENKMRKENRYGKKDNHKRNKRGQETNKTPIVDETGCETSKLHSVVACPNTEGKKLCVSVLNDVCKNSTTVKTDQLSGYGIMDGKTDREEVYINVDHRTTFPLGNGKYINKLESCWAILKRAMYGIFHYVFMKYLQRYIDEFSFRLNHCDCEEAYNTDVIFAVA